MNIDLTIINFSGKYGNTHPQQENKRVFVGGLTLFILFFFVQER